MRCATSPATSLAAAQGASMPECGDASAPASGRGVWQWGLLLPICFRAGLDGEPEDAEVCWQRLRGCVDSIERTTNREERARLRVHVGIDQHDVLFDSSEARERLHRIFEAAELPFALHSLSPKFRSKLCHIWAHLFDLAVSSDADVCVLLGDDVKLLTAGWKPEIEEAFTAIALQTGLPLGGACVAFRDEAFPVFPTFPVIHKLHLEIFGKLFPEDFVNQHGDPYLFELYARWGASQFAATASLTNELGGRKNARYLKKPVYWQGDLLDNGIAAFDAWLQSRQDVQGNGAAPFVKQMPCINVVIPSFRCDVKRLSRMTQLRVSEASARVHILIVIDNPESPNIKDVQALQSYEPNHLVRVFVQAENQGASAARNAGMAQSFGDWTVLLDDDVVPKENLLDAYLGGILRHPQAQIYVGLVKLPEAQTLVQRALIASNICFFFGVSAKMKHPPWGVTANLCVPGRHNRSVWFSPRFPRSGGGEDVDFCLRLKSRQPEPTTCIVAVPEAVVEHPFWDNPLAQVVGWATGDVICQETAPFNAFAAPPSWAECLLLLLLLWVLQLLSWRAVATCMSCVLMAEFSCGFIPEVGGQLKRQRMILEAVAVAALAMVPSLVQDVTRLVSKAYRLQLRRGLFMEFDWMDGQEEHILAFRIARLVRIILWMAMACFPCCPWMSALAIVALGLWMWSMCTVPLNDALREILLGIPIAFNTAGDKVPPTPFVVLAYQRTGSNLLCGMLHNHPQVLMHNEVFNESRCMTYIADGTCGLHHKGKDVCHPADHEGFCPANMSVIDRDRDPEYFLLRILGAGQRKFGKTLKVVGIKLFPEHWTPPRMHLLERLILDPTVKKIILRRENYLEVYTSKVRADKTMHYLGHCLDDVDVTLDPAALQAFVESYDACYAAYDTLVTGQGPESVFRLTYEQLASEQDRAEVMQHLLAFLELDTSVPEPLRVTIKQSKKELSGRIKNYHELAYAFSQTKVAPCF